MRARLKRVENLFVGQLHAIHIAIGIVQIKTEGRTRYQFFFSIGKNTNAQFGALQVGKDGNRAIEVFFDLANNRMAHLNFCVITVRHVQAEHICAGLVQCTDHRVVIRSGAKCGDNFHVAVASHIFSFVQQHR